MIDRHISSPNYTMPVFRDLPKTTRIVAKMIKDSRVKYDAIAGCGFSGLLLTGSLSALLYKHPIAVRKKSERDGGYSFTMAQGAVGVKRYIIVDDLISSGSTIEHMIHEIENESAKSYFGRPELVAVFLYHDQSDSTIQYQSFSRDRGPFVRVPVYRRPY